MSFRVHCAALVVSVLVGVADASSAVVDLLIRNARLIDGTGAPERDGVSIAIRDGRIVAIDHDVVANAARTIDASGMTILPGLIDSHVHFVYAPGSTYRDDSGQTIHELNRQHLRAYLACGVTTVLDAGAFPEVARDIERWLAAGNPGPRYLTTGPYIRPRGGYGHERFGAEESPADVERKLDLIQSLGGTGVKVAVEKGPELFVSIKQFSPEMLKAIVSGAKRRGLPLYVHAMNEEAQGQALDLGAHAIMHLAMDVPIFGSYFARGDLSDAFVTRMARSAAYQVTTLSVFDTWPGLYDLKRLDDPVTRLVVPGVEMETARAPDAFDRFAISFLGGIVPWTIERVRPPIARVVLSRGHILAALQQGQRNVLRLYRAGVPIVVGSDAPSPWPDAIYHFHGVQTAREVELLADAGLPSAAAIAAATRVPAEMLRLDREIGTIEVGKLADLVIVRGDPVTDIRALRNVAFTVKQGLARTPEQWMSS
jgi:imidazolonepropionase-like amidohydrolase